MTSSWLMSQATVSRPSLPQCEQGTGSLITSLSWLVMLPPYRWQNRLPFSAGVAQFNAAMVTKKHNPKLALNMGFSEALMRFAQADPTEVAQLVERSKTKKPPRAKKRSRGGSPSGQNVVSLRNARAKRHNG